MSPRIPLDREKIGAFCKKWHIVELSLFGSVLRDDFRPESDVDVLVDFAQGYATLRNFVGLSDHLEALFKRKVDLLTVDGIDKYIRSYVEAEVIWIEG